MIRLLSCLTLVLLASTANAAAIGLTLSPDISDVGGGSSKSYGLQEIYTSSHGGGVIVTQTNFAWGPPPNGVVSPAPFKFGEAITGGKSYAAVSAGVYNYGVVGSTVADAVAQAKITTPSSSDNAKAAGSFVFNVSQNIVVNIVRSFTNDGYNSADLYAGNVLVNTSSTTLSTGVLYTLSVKSKVTSTSPAYTPVGSETFTHYNESTITLNYAGPAGGGVVPEPASVAVFGVLGLGGLLMRRRRVK